MRLVIKLDKHLTDSDNPDPLPRFSIVAIQRVIKDTLQLDTLLQTADEAGFTAACDYVLRRWFTYSRNIAQQIEIFAGLNPTVVDNPSDSDPTENGIDTATAVALEPEGVTES